jgi:hypothetical protein
MVMISRRSFVGATLGGVALCCVPARAKGVEDGKYDVAWDEAELRNEVGDLMNKENVVLFYRHKNGEDDYDCEDVVNADISLRHLGKIKDVLCLEDDFGQGLLGLDFFITDRNVSFSGEDVYKVLAS